MPRLTNEQRARTIAAAAAIAAIVGIGVIATRDYTERATAVIEDAGLDRARGSQRMTDLLTGIVEPGATVTTGVSLPAGSRVTSIAPGGPWIIVEENHTDHDEGTWYEVTARNTGPGRIRFVAFVTFDVPAEPITPGDAGP